MKTTSSMLHHAYSLLKLGQATCKLAQPCPVHHCAPQHCPQCPGKKEVINRRLKNQIQERGGKITLLVSFLQIVLLKL